MIRTIATIATAATLGFALSGPAAAYRSVEAVSMKGKQGYTPPPDTYAGSYFTTSDGCSYRKAQAPGYQPTWHLIINPHHIGKPPAHRGCPGSLRN